VTHCGRTCRLEFRLTPTELAELEAAARRSRNSISQYVRMRLFGLDGQRLATTGARCTSYEEHARKGCRNPLCGIVSLAADDAADDAYDEPCPDCGHHTGGHVRDKGCQVLVQTLDYRLRALPDTPCACTTVCWPKAPNASAPA
jgi:hypothetical protein